MDDQARALRAGEAPNASPTDLQQALDQKTALLHEVDHRVKNNLQLISSLLLLQARQTDDPAVNAALKGMLNRVTAVATVHRRLFQAEDVQRFDVAAFVRDLVDDTVGGSERTDIVVSLDLERIDVAASKAAPLALVINELLCNAMHHAFPVGRPGHINIVIRREGDDFRIEIADDGVGFPSATVPAPCFGLNVVRLLCQQLRATFETETIGPGVRMSFDCPSTACIETVDERPQPLERPHRRRRGAPRHRTRLPGRGGRLQAGRSRHVL